MWRSGLKTKLRSFQGLQEKMEGIGGRTGVLGICWCKINRRRYRSILDIEKANVGEKKDEHEGFWGSRERGSGPLFSF